MSGTAGKVESDESKEQTVELLEPALAEQPELAERQELAEQPEPAERQAPERSFAGWR
jgi:hypothetical protein